MSEPLQFFVEGTPKGQPRPRAVIRGMRAGVFDPGTADEWKAAVAEVWRNVVGARGLQPREGAVRVTLLFYMPRPKGHFGAKGLKPSAPLAHTGKPDLDNLAKAVLDVLTRLEAWNDDSQVNFLTVARRWADGKPGCHIQIRDGEEQ